MQTLIFVSREQLVAFAPQAVRVLLLCLVSVLVGQLLLARRRSLAAILLALSSAALVILAMYIPPGWAIGGAIFLLGIFLLQRPAQKLAPASFLSAVSAASRQSAHAINLRSPQAEEASYPTTYPNSLIAPFAKPAQEPVIEIQHLNHYFGKGALRKQVLSDINLSIYPGEIVIMTGPSGSGKTTLLTLIGALRSTHEGSLRVLGRELQGSAAKMRTQIRREIGFVFQAHNLLPFMTARQNVRMALELKAVSDRKQTLYKADQVLERVGLVNQINSYPEKLSGGQKQRVAIARALVNEPALVLADEPTASLDSKSGRDVVQLMQALAKEQHCAILLVTHDNRILDIADRIIYIENGILLKDQKQQVSSLQSKQTDLHLPTPLSVSRDRHLAQSAVPLSRSAAQLLDTSENISPGNISVEISLPPAPNGHKTYTVACIDHCTENLKALKTYLADDLFWMMPIQDPVQALTDITKYRPDLIFLDIDLPKMNGYEVAGLIRKNDQFASIPIILMTKDTKNVDLKRAKAFNIENFLIKPFSQLEMITTIFPMLT